ncbi:conserved hypothetical protein [Ricinus communis]|uniref:Uncharacterized protein n=1 Tax=Ricinus communis TaxID=3988 RepID=B9SQU7_RICCO|nr:conserved hypothetical protein [Ricinus communis]
MALSSLCIFSRLRKWSHRSLLAFLAQFEPIIDDFSRNIVQWFWELECSFCTRKPFKAAILVTKIAPNAVAITVHRPAPHKKLKARHLFEVWMHIRRKQHVFGRAKGDTDLNMRLVQP